MSSSGTPEPSAASRALRSEVRNPRRRPRQSDADSIRAAPRRKRSKLSEDTFAPRGTIEMEELEELEEADGHVTMNGRPSSGRKASGTPMAADATMMEMPLRGGRKNTLKRAAKGDGATVLTSNSIYSVKQLPSTPKELKKAEYRGSIVGTAHQHLALAVTREKAYVWDYTAHTAVSNARVFDLPFPVRDGEVLPFGALVASNGSSSQTEVGLLLVSATTGRIVYYESIERAASLGLFQERKTGVEGVISGYSSSETVIELTAAEHAGFVIALSSGRIIQLTLRDAQGKARIFTQPLRPGHVSSSGIFGSLKGLLSGGWKRGITAVRTRPLDHRGQMQAVALTERCETQTWNLDWSGRYEYRHSGDFREHLMKELRGNQGIESQGAVENLAALDFVILERFSARGDELVRRGSAEASLVLLVLVRVGSADSHEYWLAELTFSGEDSRVERIWKLESYDGRTISGRKPRLLLPKPGHTVMVVFEDAIVLASTSRAEPTDDPNAQLHDDSYVESAPFEEALRLRSDNEMAFMGACAEESRAGHSSSIAFVNGAGLVRFSATDPAGDRERERLSAKSKIEEAIFHGVLQDNIFDFSTKSNYVYPITEVQRAALDISDEILGSKTHFISESPSSLEAHLDYRARALRALVNHVRRNYPTISRTVLWQLLWDAEKVAAAQAMWRAFEEHKEAARAATGKRSATVVDELCAQLAQHHGLAELEQSGHEDPVRRFFVKGVARVDYLLSHIKGLLETLKSDQSEKPEKVVRYVNESDDLWIKGLETAFAFREENATTYGIAPGLLKDAILVDTAEYAELPEFWTSTAYMLNASSNIATLSRDFAKDIFEKPEITPEDASYVEKITALNPHLIQLCCLIYRERIGWLSSRPSQRDQEVARLLESNFEKERYDQFRSLVAIAKVEEGMSLAERYRDMVTLTEIVIGESQYLWDELQNPELDAKAQQMINDQLEGLNAKTSKYFEKFGDDWANAFFDEAFSGSRGAGSMLDKAQQNWKNHLTTYLRADPARARLCWINDITAAKDFSQAVTALIDTATEHEATLWAKKVELSIGKLSLLAAEEEGVVAATVDFSRPDRELRVVEIQEKLYRCLYHEAISALDREAAMQLIMEKFGTKCAEYESLQQLLEAKFSQILDHIVLSVEDLIDVLTLMESRVFASEAQEPEANLQGNEILLALQALNAVAPEMPQDKFDMLLQLIWKRCYVYDDWVSITSTHGRKSKTDSEIEISLHTTLPWRTFYNLHEMAFFNRPDCAIRILAPSDCLGAACKREDLADRFPDDELLDPILRDNLVQDQVLQDFVDDRKLDEWIKSTEDNAVAAVHDEAERRAVLRQKERDLSLQLESGGGGGANGKVNGLVNGLTNGDGVLEIEDGDGDVDMA
jgi:nuclear pore complex protein Nup133